MGSNNQSACINTAITNISYSTTGATGATFNGLPPGIVGNWVSNIITISGTPTTSIGSPFNYTVTLTGGCGNISATGTITVIAANTIVLTSGTGTNNQSTCISTAITNIAYSTTGATGATFNGLPPGVAGNWVSNIVTISGTPTTSIGSPFNYTVTLTGGCGNISTTGTITVIAANTIALTSGTGTNNQSTCINTAITNITYSTTGATGATFNGLPPGVTGNWVSNIVTISGTPNTSTGSPFNYTVTLTGGCWNISATGTITVIAANTIALTSGIGTNNQSTCVNTAITNITYSTTGAIGVTFNGLPPGVVGNWVSNSVTISGTPNTSIGSPFNYTVTLTGGCGNISATGTITVNPLPIVFAGQDKSITYNTSTPINDSEVTLGTPPYNFSWSPTSIFYNDTLLHPTTKPMTSSVECTLTATDQNSCTHSDQIIITVTGGPLTVNASASPSTICSGETIYLSVLPGGGSGTYTFYWSNPEGFNSTSQFPHDNPDHSTTYQVSVSDGASVVIRSVPVTVNPLPNVYNLTGGGSYCVGGIGVPIDLSGSQSGLKYQLKLGGSNVGPLITGTGSSISFGLQQSPTSTGATYTAIATNNSTNCTNIMNGTVTVTINPLPDAIAGPDLFILVNGGSIKIEGAKDNGTGVNWEWIPEDKFLNNKILNPTTVNLFAPLFCTLTVTGANGCSKSDDLIITVPGNPLNVAPTANPKTICFGNSTQLDAVASGGAGGYKYLWKGGQDSFDSTSATPIVTPKQTTNYTVTVIDDANNPKTGNITVTVNPLPTSFAVIGGGDFCEGGEGKEIRLSGSQLSTVYHLLQNGNETGTIIDGNNDSINFGKQLVEGTYKVKAINGFTCSNNMDDSAVIRIASKIIAQSLHAKRVNDKTLVLIYPESGNYDFQWYMKESGIESAIPEANLQYYILKIDDLTGSKEFKVYIKPKVAEYGLYCGDYSPAWSNASGKSFFFEGNDIFLMYPNPAEDKVTIILNEEQFGKDPINGEVRINNLSCKNVASYPIHNVREEISVHGLSRGVYMVVVEVNGQLHATRKLIIL